MKQLVYLFVVIVHQAYAGVNIMIEEKSIENYNIINQYKLRTLTECVLKCENNRNCTMVNVRDSVDHGMKICILLEKNGNESSKTDVTKDIQETKQNSMTNPEMINMTIIPEFGMTIREINNGMTFFSQIFEPSLISGWSNWSQPRCHLIGTKCKSVLTRVCNGTASKSQRICCSGPWKMLISCKKKLCPVNGGFSDWKNKTECSATCGGGVQTFYRLCDNPEPKYGGDNCSGNDTKTRHCNTQPCPISTTSIPKTRTLKIIKDEKTVTDETKNIALCKIFSIRYEFKIISTPRRRPIFELRVPSSSSMIYGLSVYSGKIFLLVVNFPKSVADHHLIGEIRENKWYSIEIEQMFKSDASYCVRYSLNKEVQNPADDDYCYPNGKPEYIASAQITLSEEPSVYMRNFFIVGAGPENDPEESCFDEINYVSAEEMKKKGYTLGREGELERAGRLERG